MIAYIPMPLPQKLMHMQTITKFTGYDYGTSGIALPQMGIAGQNSKRFRKSINY
jgi:hypothetical protein